MKKRLLLLLSILCMSIICACGVSANNESTNEINSEESTDLSNDISDSTNGNQSVTYDFYIMATTLSKTDLSKNSLGAYEYNGISFITEDCNWIDNSLNTTGSVESGAFYRKMAMCLEGFTIGNKWSDYAKHIIGFIPNNREEFIPYVENASEFIVTNNAFEAILNKFQNISVIDNFDSSLNKYTIIINDTAICAEEMQISEEMLGYILAVLTEYGTEISFDGNYCTISCIN